MSAGKSSLNPYAASYIPLARRGVAGESNRGYELTANASKSGNEALWPGPLPGNTTLGQYQKPSQSYNAHHTVSGDSKLKGHTYASYGSSSLYPNEMTEKHTLDEEHYMDLAFLQMTFTGVSDESLSDVYLANKCDLDATIDMLHQLEIQTVIDSSENLPDSLDIGDVSVFAAGPEYVVSAGEVSASSSSSGSQHGSRHLST